MMVVKTCKTLYGTAREGWENRAYDKLVERYDEHTAKKLIEEHLKEACGEDLKGFASYRNIRKAFHQGKLSFSKAHKEARELAGSVLAEG